ncbi:MAG: VOC family protein [Gemmatimonadota bacterium]|nr:VOC family protein [Gemmatimonadota bacterium]
MSDTSAASESSTLPRLLRLTPVMVVDSVDACLPFWTEKLGFELTNHVPGPDGSMIFAILERDGIEVMYQSAASVLEDGTMTEAELAGHSVGLFVTVHSLDDIEPRLAGAPVVKARHQTFYGSTEIYVKEPGGNTVGFAQMG